MNVRNEEKYFKFLRNILKCFQADILQNVSVFKHLLYRKIKHASETNLKINEGKNTKL